MTNVPNPTQLFPMFMTDKIEETKAFYLRAGFKVRYAMGDEYLQVYYGDALDLSFAKPHQSKAGMDYPGFEGKGVLVSVPTKSADEMAVELKGKGFEIMSEVEDKPWGWRSFHVADPNGIVLDFFHAYQEPPPANEPS